MTKPWPPESLAPRFREVCWRLVGLSGKPLVCSIERRGGGFEVRAEHEPGDLIGTRWTRELTQAREWASALKAELLADPSFSEIGDGS